MADYEKAFARLMDEEGVKLTDTQHDKGGLTYAGISRKFHPKWEGWQFVDVGSTPPLDLVRAFYRDKYWSMIKGEQINSQRVAEVLFSQTVNNEEAGIKLMQRVVGVIPDGVVGPKTVAAINAASMHLKVTPEDALLMMYSTAHSKRFHEIGMRRKDQRIFWAGWWARALRIIK